MRPTSPTHSSFLFWLLLCLLAFSALPWNAHAAEETLRPGHKVSASIKGQWKEATVIEVRANDKYVVTEAWGGWADETYPYSAVQLTNGSQSSAQNLKPGMPINVNWNGSYYPSRVVSISPQSVVIRFDSSSAGVYELDGSQIRSVTQPTPRPGSPGDGRSRTTVNAPPPQFSQPSQPQPPQSFRVSDSSPPTPPIQSGSRLTRTTSIDTKNIQFLDTGNRPLSNLKLSPSAKGAILNTNSNGDLSLNQFAATPWFEVTSDNQITMRILTDHPWFKRGGNIVAPLPLGIAQIPELVQANVQVFLPEGQPAANAWVYVQTLRRGSINEDWSWLRIKTDYNGRASFKMLPTTQSQLSRRTTVEYIDFVAEYAPAAFQSPGDPPQMGAAAVAPAFAHCLMSEKFEIRFQAGKPRLLTLTDKSDQPLTQDQLSTVKILVQKPNTEKREFIPLTWQSHIPFRFPDGQYRVDFPGNPSRYFTIRGTQSPDQIPVSFKPEFRASGRVLTPSGEPASNIPVLMLNVYGPRFDPDKLTPEAWTALEKTRTSSGPPSPIPLALTDDTTYTPAAIAWTDAQGRYTIETDVKGPVAVAGRALLLHQAMPDFQSSTAPDLYAIPCGTFIFTPGVHSNRIKLSSVGLDLTYPDTATPASIRNLDPASISIFSRYPAQSAIKLRVPAGYPLSIRIIGPSTTIDIPPITIPAGQVAERGIFILPDPASRYLGFTATDANRTPIPQIKVSLQSAALDTLTYTDRKGFSILSLPLDINHESIIATFQGANLVNTRTRLTRLPSLDDPEGTTLTALFPQTIYALASPDPVMTDAAGKPLAAFPVRVEGFLGVKIIDTDASGALSSEKAMSVLPFNITVTTPDKRRYAWSPNAGSGPRTLPIPVPENKSLPLISGRVLLPDGKPAANCLVGAYPNTLPPGSKDLATAYPITSGVYTDQDGSFTLSPTWNEQIAPLSAPPKNWVVVAQGDSQRSPGLTAALCTISDTASPLTLTLPQTRPVDITMSLPASVTYNTAQKNPAFLARVDPQTGIRLIIATLRPGTQPSSLDLSPGRYFFLNQLACSAPIDLAAAATTLTSDYPTAQSFRFTVVDAETQKPVPAALLGAQLPVDSVASFDDFAWDSLKSNRVKSDIYPYLVTNEQGVCEKTATDAATDPSFLSLQVCARGYISTLIPNVPLLTSPNAQGVKEIRIALQPATRMRIAPEKYFQTRENPPRQDQSLTLRVITSPASPNSESPTGEQILTYPVASTGGYILVPSSGRFWLVARDRHAAPSDLAAIATPTPDALWLTRDPITLTPTSVITLGLLPVATIPVNFKVVDPAGNPIPGAYIAPSLKDSNTGVYQAITDAQGLARLNLPLGLAIDLKVDHPAFPGPVTNPAWTHTVSDSPTGPNPVILRLKDPIRPTQ